MEGGISVSKVFPLCFWKSRFTVPVRNTRNQLKGRTSCTFHGFKNGLSMEERQRLWVPWALHCLEFWKDFSTQILYSIQACFIHGVIWSASKCKQKNPKTKPHKTIQSQQFGIHRAPCTKVLLLYKNTTLLTAGKVICINVNVFEVTEQDRIYLCLVS